MRGKEQNGFVSIIVTIIFTLIISAITISFSVLMSREQRQALDDQLSAQALYAAESAANYAREYDLATKTTCTLPPPIDIPLDGVGGVIAPTCLLVNDSPDEIIVDSVGTTRPTIFQIETVVDKLTFAWQDTAGGTSFNSTDTKFTSAAAWPSRPGVVEVTIYPVTGSVNSTALLDSARTYYLYPNSVAEDAVNFSSTTDGTIARGGCSAADTPLHCQVTVSGLPTAAPVTGYLLRLRSIYNPVTMQINGKTAADVPVPLRGAQTVVDSTGKASDVVRRIQIRYATRPGFNGPIFGIETAGDICKRLDVWPGNASDLCP